MNFNFFKFIFKVTSKYRKINYFSEIYIYIKCLKTKKASSSE